MSAKRKHIHLPYTTYALCKKDGGVSSNKSNANCKTCLKLYKDWKLMITELNNFGGKGLNANHILIKHGFLEK